MFEFYEKVSTTFNKIRDIEMQDNNPFLLEIVNNGVKYEFFVRINRKSKILLVFGSGAYKPSEMTLPVFQRHSWISDFEESMIYYNDPTLYLDRLTLGWGFGVPESHYLKVISDILKNIINLLGYKYDNTYFYGSSAGGFMSMILASMLKGSTAIVNNPQTIFTNYHPGPVKKLLNALDISEETAITDYEERVNVVSSFRKYGYIPRIYYLQNAFAKNDMENHLIPFLNEIKKLVGLDIYNNLKIELYFNHKLGHNPIGKTQTINFIKNIIYNKYK